MNARELMNILTDEVNMDDLVLAQSNLKTLDAGYDSSGIETPEWVIDKLTAVSSEINSRNRAELQRQLRTLRAQQMADMTMSERRKTREDKIKELEGKLGG